MILNLPSHEHSKRCVKDNLNGVPEKPGCYLIWSNAQLIYVGISGKTWTAKAPKSSHLKRRLADHFRVLNPMYFL